MSATVWKEPDGRVGFNRGAGMRFTHVPVRPERICRWLASRGYDVTPLF